MINKIIETSLDGKVTVLLDCGKGFVDKAVKRMSGKRYSIIPTREDYKLLNDNISFESILPVYSKYGVNCYVESNELDNFKSFTDLVNEDFVTAVYDRHNGGWVVGSIKEKEWVDNTASHFGLFAGQAEVLKAVIRELKNKFSTFVFNDKFVFTFPNPTINGFETSATTKRGNCIQVAVDENGLHFWSTFENNDYDCLYFRLVARILREFKIKLPKFLFEFSKFNGLSSNLVQDEYSLQNLVAVLAQIRTLNHIDTSTIMTNANTPEVITGKTPQEILETYMSSLFKTETHREGEYTDVYEHFENLFDELVSDIAFSCLVPANGGWL